MPGDCRKALHVGQARLKEALARAVARGETIANRTMFATDWLMLSQVKRWADYPASLLASLEKIAPTHVEEIMGGNASEVLQPDDDLISSHATSSTRREVRGGCP